MQEQERSCLLGLILAERNLGANATVSGGKRGALNSLIIIPDRSVAMKNESARFCPSLSIQADGAS